MLRRPGVLQCAKGLGRVRHIEVNQLWVQDKVASGELVIHKVGTDENIADVLTKYVDKRLLEKHTTRMSTYSDVTTRCRT